MDWNEMTGNHLQRFCSHCEKNVHDVSAMSCQDAEALLASGAKLCVRFYRDSSGAVMTAESPSRVLVERRVFAKAVAAGAASALLPIFGQEKTASPLLTGTVHDSTGGVVTNAQTFVKRGDQILTKGTTDSKGQFRFEKLSPGTYQFIAQYPGFRSATKDVSLPENTQVHLDVELQVAEVGGAGMPPVEPHRSVIPNKLK